MKGIANGSKKKSLSQPVHKTSLESPLYQKHKCPCV